PAWVRDLFAVDAQKVLDDDELHRVDADRFTLMTARVRGAAEMSPADGEEKTAAAYASIARELSQARSRHAVRFWNHVPFITDPADSGRDNYMVFNAGRCRAFAEWFGSPHSFDRSLATASAIGHWGSDL